MKKITVFILAFFVMLSTSYGQVKETRGVGNFTAIKASSGVNVVYTQGPIQNIEVTWEKDLMKFFKELKKSGAEFGYRTASEIGRLMFSPCAPCS